MTTLTKRDGLFPSVFSDLFDTERFFGAEPFERFMGISPFSKINRWVPAVNITENEKEYTIKVAAPGLQKNDFKVEVENDILTVKTEKEEEKREKDEQYTRREFSFASFSRSFQLPNTVKSEELKAKYADGILTISIPKKEEALKKSLRKEISIG